MQNENNNSDKLDNLEQSLYSPRRDVEAQDRKRLRHKEYVIARDWEDQNAAPVQESHEFSATPPKKNWFITFFVLTLLFFLAAAGFVGYKFIFQDGIEAKNVDILVNAPLTIGAGEVLTFDVLLQNKNQVDMNTVDMTIEFPDGTRSSSDISKNYPIVRDELGSISVGSFVKNNYSALLFGEEGDKKEITISLSYRVEGSNLLVEKEKNFEVILKSTPIRMNVTNVKSITSGQDLTFNIELVSNSTQVLDNVIVQATYPFGFTYQDSSIAPKSDKKTWVIDRLEPKEIVNFTVQGTLEGQNNEERYFSFITGLEDAQTGTPQVVFNTKGTTITLERPFFEIGFSIDEKSGDVIILDPDTIYNATVAYKNNTDVQLRNAIINLSLSGEAINKNTIRTTEGFYQSTDNTVTFDNSTAGKLKSLAVGSSGGVTFSFSGATSRDGTILVNPEVSVVATVEANRNPDNAVPEIIDNSVTKKIRFNTQSRLDTQSEYYNSNFVNSGPIPPKAEQKTTYTAVFKILNTTNKISEGVLTAKIPNYVTFDGIFSPNTADFSYDSKTRILSWNVGTVNEKTGYHGNSAKQLAIQVSILPSVSQVGTAPSIVTDIVFTGKDTYTQTNISKSGSNITTAIVGSQTFYDAQVSR